MVTISLIILDTRQSALECLQEKISDLGVGICFFLPEVTMLYAINLLILVKLQGLVKVAWHIYLSERTNKMGKRTKVRMLLRFGRRRKKHWWEL